MGQFLASVGDTCRVAMGGGSTSCFWGSSLLQQLQGQFPTHIVNNPWSVRNSHCAQVILLPIAILWKRVILEIQAMLIVNNSNKSEQCTICAQWGEVEQCVTSALVCRPHTYVFVFVFVFVFTSLWIVFFCIYLMHTQREYLKGLFLFWSRKKKNRVWWYSYS